MNATFTIYSREFLPLFLFFYLNNLQKMSYGSAPYTAPPPRYDEESAQPLMGEHQDDDMFKEMVVNSSKEVRLRKLYT